MKKLHQYTSLLRRTVHCLSFAFLTTAGLSIAGEASPALERSWQLKLSGQPSGSFDESTMTGTDGSVRTKERMAMEINRLGSRVSITNEIETVESRDGEMQSLLATMSSSEAATHLRVTRADHVLQVIYEKLKVTDRTEAVVRAIQRGIIRV